MSSTTTGSRTTTAPMVVMARLGRNYPRDRLWLLLTSMVLQAVIRTAPALGLLIYLLFR